MKKTKLKYARLASRLYGKPLLINEMEFYNISNTFLSLTKNGKRAMDDFDNDNDMDVQPITPYDTLGKVAVVTLSGPIIKHADLMETFCGATDIDSFLSKVQKAYIDPNIETILLDINSPGGETTGLKECADAIREMSKSKQIVSFTDSLCASAAYWIASATNGIFVTETSNIGSIGVYFGAYDYSEAFAKEGIKPVLIKSGDFKGDGFPGMPFSDETKKRIQTEIEQINTMFRNSIAQKRTLQDEDMQGQVFLGMNAIDKGIADAIVTNMDSLIAILNQED
jgi:signal peptide peptidase SppA